MVSSSLERFLGSSQWKSGCYLFFFVMTVFIRECEKKTAHSLFGSFWKKLLQIVTERLTNLKGIVSECDKKVLQSVKIIT